MGDNVTEVLIVKITRDIWRESSKHLLDLWNKPERSVKNIGLRDSNMYRFSFSTPFTSLLPWSSNHYGKFFLSFSEVETGIRTQLVNTVLNKFTIKKSYSWNPGKPWPSSALQSALQPVLTMNPFHSASSSENKVPLNSCQPAESTFRFRQTTSQYLSSELISDFKQNNSHRNGHQITVPTQAHLSSGKFIAQLTRESTARDRPGLHLDGSPKNLSDLAMELFRWDIFNCS